MNIQPNMWDQLCEVSGWDRHAAKVSILGSIYGKPQKPTDATLFDTWLELVRADPTLLKGALV